MHRAHGIDVFEREQVLSWRRDDSRHHVQKERVRKLMKLHDKSNDPAPSEPNSASQMSVNTFKDFGESDAMMRLDDD